MILCDTNILIEFYKNNHAIVQELRFIGPSEIGVSVITQAELYFGAINKQELASIRQHLSLIQRYPVDSAISEEFIRLMEGFALSHGLKIPDALIAATTIVHKLEFYTLNTKDFRFIPGIQLYSPQTGTSAVTPGAEKV